MGQANPGQKTLFDLTGRSALVTGAAGGIGAAVAQALATAGAGVLVTDNRFPMTAIQPTRCVC